MRSQKSVADASPSPSPLQWGIQPARQELKDMKDMKELLPCERNSIALLLNRVEADMIMRVAIAICSN
ncbi:hypothetical protein AWZ03_000297 [Drosophila navojoa]|uniref:Uncharacterized protein n=1 Tax=Drosophila navojoa TaxID=7232 RepID=A0A484C1R5_DRONA|nr:hypothetical protein AWZ03_000297 [Drosophila navojoa]